MKRMRKDFRYTPQTYADSCIIRGFVEESFKKGLEMGYDPSDVYYEVSSALNEVHILHMLEKQNE